MIKLAQLQHKPKEICIEELPIDANNIGFVKPIQSFHAFLSYNGVLKKNISGVV